MGSHPRIKSVERHEAQPRARAPDEGAQMGKNHSCFLGTGPDRDAGPQRLFRLQIRTIGFGEGGRNGSRAVWSYGQLPGTRPIFDGPAGERAYRRTKTTLRGSDSAGKMGPARGNRRSSVIAGERGWLLYHRLGAGSGWRGPGEDAV